MIRGSKAKVLRYQQASFFHKFFCWTFSGALQSTILTSNHFVYPEILSPILLGTNNWKCSINCRKKILESVRLFVSLDCLIGNFIRGRNPLTTRTFFSWIFQSAQLLVQSLNIENNLFNGKKTLMFEKVHFLILSAKSWFCSADQKPLFCHSSDNQSRDETGTLLLTLDPCDPNEPWPWTQYVTWEKSKLRKLDSK